MVQNKTSTVNERKTLLLPLAALVVFVAAVNITPAAAQNEVGTEVSAEVGGSVDVPGVIPPIPDPVSTIEKFFSALATFVGALLGLIPLPSLPI